ncbi:MAG TPA: hypothetical protein VG649_15230 [Candidatus Angelobacter sp.]|jgi:hypothetical protein|nr:hypothetical protein [Candidatus Angelobacter sp.]
MIEQAYVSGQLGKAIYLDDAGGYFMYSNSSPRPVQCRWGDIQLLLNSGAEFKELRKNLYLDRIRNVLQFEERRHTALFLCLAGWDEQLTDSARDHARDAAEKILQDYNVANFIMNRLLSRPMPDGLFDRDIGGLAKTPVLESIYQVVFEKQPAIHAVSRIWDEVARAGFESHQEALRAQQFLTDEGFFTSAVSALASRDAKWIGTLAAGFTSYADLKKITPQISDILDSFLKQLRNFASTNLQEVANEGSRKFTTSEDRDTTSPEAKQVLLLDHISTKFPVEGRDATPPEAKQVLLLDDNSGKFSVWEMILRRAQFKCVRTSGSQAASLYAEGWLEKIGIVITVDSAECVRQIRGYDQKIPNHCHERSAAGKICGAGCQFLAQTDKPGVYFPSAGNPCTLRYFTVCSTKYFAHVKGIGS